MERDDQYRIGRTPRKLPLSTIRQMRAGQGDLFSGFVSSDIIGAHGHHANKGKKEWRKLEVSIEREGDIAHCWVSVKTQGGDRRERLFTLHGTRLSAMLLELLHEIEDMGAGGSIKGL